MNKPYFLKLQLLRLPRGAERVQDWMDVSHSWVGGWSLKTWVSPIESQTCGFLSALAIVRCYLTIVLEKAHGRGRARLGCLFVIFVLWDVDALRCRSRGSSSVVH